MSINNDPNQFSTRYNIRTWELTWEMDAEGYPGINFIILHQIVAKRIHFSVFEVGNVGLKCSNFVILHRIVAQFRTIVLA